MLEVLLIKNKVFNEEVFSENLFISLDNKSALRHDYIKVLDFLKVYDNYEIIKEKRTKLVEGYSENVYILSCMNKEETKIFFIRLVIINNNSLSDVLVYTLGNDILEAKSNVDYYENIFFNDISFKPTAEFLEYFESIKQPKICFVLEKKHLKLVHETNLVLNMIGYEDWDFENKHQNYLDMVLNDESYESILKNLNKDATFEIVFDTAVNQVYKFNCSLKEFKMQETFIYFIIIK